MDYFSLFFKIIVKKFGHIKKKQYLCTRFWKIEGRMLISEAYLVVIAQLAEHRIVVPSVVGSLRQKL